MDLFIVRFIRRDGKPDEEYYYHTREDAERHFLLFRDDDSGLYREIVMTHLSGDAEEVLNRLRFDAI